MGYDINRFEGDVDEELICPICSQILEDPVQVKINEKFKMIIFKF
jgi:E3 ubiquitin-protein ligase NRDP1